MAGFDKLEGDLVTLERIRANGFDELYQRFQDPALYETAGLRRPPERDVLYHDLFEDEGIVVWEVVPENAPPLAYAFYVDYDGPPYIQVWFFDGKLDLDVAADAMQLMVHTFFKYRRKEKQLFTFVPQPVPEDVRARLVEAGFDEMDQHPTIDLAVESVFVMERHTYDAYYGEEEDESEKELDFDEAPEVAYDEGDE